MAFCLYAMKLSFINFFLYINLHKGWSLLLTNKNDSRASEPFCNPISFKVLVTGLEPATPSLRVTCTTNCATPAFCEKLHKNNNIYEVVFQFFLFGNCYCSPKNNFIFFQTSSLQEHHHCYNI